MALTRIKRFSPIQLGKVLAVLYGILSLIFVPFFLIFGLIGAAGAMSSGQGGAAPAAAMGGLALFMVILMPVMYTVMGFIFGALAALIYNLAAKWVGGIEIELEEVG